MSTCCNYNSSSAWEDKQREDVGKMIRKFREALPHVEKDVFNGKDVKDILAAFEPYADEYESTRTNLRRLARKAGISFRKLPPAT